MPESPSRARRGRPRSHATKTAVLLALVIATAATFAQSGVPSQFLGGPAPVPYPNFDIRTYKGDPAWAAAPGFGAYLEKVGPAAANGVSDLAVRRVSGVARLETALPGVRVEASALTGNTEVVSVMPGTTFLTGPSTDRVAALRGFLAAHAAAFGVNEAQVGELVVLANEMNPAGNMAWVELEQRFNGIPVFQGYLRGGFTPKGELGRVNGLLAEGIAASALNTVPSLGAPQAIAQAAATVNLRVDESALVEQPALVDGQQRFARSGMADEPTAWLVYFPLQAGVARLAWLTQIWTDTEAFMVVVDAETGTMLFRKNLTSYQAQSATYNVYSSDSPAPWSPTASTPGDPQQAPYVPRVTVTRIGNEGNRSFNNLGWLTDGTNTTDGNNVEAGIDRDGTNGVDPASIQAGSPNRVFSASYTPGTDDPLTAAHQRGSVINMFYWVNEYHDLTYLLGFTEAFRNFQHNNFGRGGAAADRISAEGQDSSGVNNANFSTPADGGRGRMQMYLWNGPSPDYDGTIDQDIVFHELTHGLSNRLHANAAGLSTNMAGGMGEGWSDFYARSLLSTADENVNGNFSIGGWATHLAAAGYTANYYSGIRRFPYAPRASTGGPLNRPHSPLTFADIDSTQADLTDGAFPRGPFGVATVDQVHNIGEVWAGMLWEVRARFVTRLGHAVGNQRFLQYVTDGMKGDPVGPTMIQARDSILAAATTAGASAADIDDIWRGFATRGMGVMAQVTNAGNGGNNTRVVESYLTPSDPIPSFTIDDVSVTEGNAGITTATFTVSLASPSASAASVAYTVVDGTATGSTAATSTGGANAIPGSGTGASAGAPAAIYPSAIAVAGVGTIQSLSVRLNSLSHTFPADIDAMLVGPGGQRVMLMSDVGGGDDLSGVTLTIRDGAPAFPASAIVSGTYAPTDASPGESLPAPAPPGPYGTALSVFNGTSANGTWNLYISDDAAVDTGSLTSWSLLITAVGTADYVPTSGVVNFAPGQTSRPITVTVNGDTVAEPNETFFVNLSNPFNAVISDDQGLGIIVNDDGGSFPVPTTANDAFLTAANTPLTVPAPGVLANDASNGGGALTAIRTAGPTSGALTLNANGSFTYTPAAGFVGVASFTYRASSPNGPGNVATVSIAVGGLPTTTNDSLSTTYPTPLNVSAPGVLANDASNGGGALSAVLVTNVSNGTLALGANGSVSYTPNFGFAGVDSFTYRAQNASGAGNVATVTITVAPPTNVQAPYNLRVESVTGTIVTLRWDALPIGPQAATFVLEGGLAPGEVLASIPTGSAAPIFTFVAPIGSFSIRMHGQLGSDKSAASNEIPLHVAVPVPPSAPTNLLGLVNGSTLGLSWKNTFGGGPATDVILDVTGSAVLSIPMGATERFSFAPAPDGTYTFRVRQANAGGVSAASSPVTLSFPAACTGAPQPPANFLAYRIGATVYVIWDPPAGGPTPTVYVLDVSGSFVGGFATPDRTLSGDVGPGSYHLRVQALNPCGASAFTAVQVVSVP